MIYEILYLISMWPDCTEASELNSRTTAKIIALTSRGQQNRQKK